MQLDEALHRIEVSLGKRKGTATSACRLTVQPQNEAVQFGVIAGGAGYFHDFCDAIVG